MSTTESQQVYPAPVDMQPFFALTSSTTKTLAITAAGLELTL